MEKEETPKPAEKKTAQEEYDEIKKLNDNIQEEIIRTQKLRAESLLASTAGGRVESNLMSEEDIKKEAALNYWKGTSIEDAIKKQNG